MQIGFNLPISGPMSAPEIVTRIAQEGEAMGYDYLTLTDHILLPNLKVPGYPYSESGEFFTEGPQNRHDQLTAAAYIAAKTSAYPAGARGHGGSLSAGRAGREDAGDDRRIVGWPAYRRHRRRLARGGIRRGGGDPFCRARRGHRRIHPRFSDFVDRGSAALRRQLGQVRRSLVRTQTGAKTIPADLGRRRKRAGPAPRRATRRRLVPDRQQQQASARHPAALPGRRRTAAPLCRSRPAATRPRSR